MSGKKKQNPGLVAELMNCECERLYSYMLDVRVDTAEFIRRCVGIVGKKGSADIPPTALWKSSLVVSSVRATAKGDVIVHCKDGIDMDLEDMPADDAVQIARILNCMVVDAVEHRKGK
jgi:hypothetical protein